MKTNILITGANGQLAQCIKSIERDFPQLSLTFLAKQQLDITDAARVAEIFTTQNFHFCINTAAYTNVEKAETETETAFAINAEGAKNIAEACTKNNITLLHISTDYVFDGTKKAPYVETDTTNPINVYGASKLKGELYIQEICESHYILRTSWLYSTFGKNFYTSMLKFAHENRTLSITTAETGCPTNAFDLARVCLQLVSEKEKQIPFGSYHYSNNGSATWYDFAKQIFKSHDMLGQVKLSKTNFYPTAAKRPSNSVMDKAKIEMAFRTEVLDWKYSLKNLTRRKS